MTEVFWQRKVRQNCYKPLRSPKKPPTIKQKSNLVSRVWQSSQNFISCLRSVCYILLWLFVESANKKEHVYNTPLDIIYIVRQICLGRSLFYYAFFWCGFLCNALCVGAFFNNCRLEFDNIFFQVFALVGAI